MSTASPDDFVPDIWGDAPPRSGPVLVVSSKAPGVRYIGRMMGSDFHVILEHAAALVGAGNTQLYRALRRRMMPGWQVWREVFYDNGVRVLRDCLTFAGVRAFFSQLAVPGLPSCDPYRLHLAWPAFEGDAPEGMFYPLPARPYALDVMRIPNTPLRALRAGRFLFPCVERSDGLWIPQQTFCRWFGLSSAAVGRFLNDHRGEFGEKSWLLTGVGGPRQLYVPVRRMSECLLALAALWRSNGMQVWERALELSYLLDGWRPADTASQTVPQNSSKSLPDAVVSSDEEDLRACLRDLRARVEFLEQRGGSAAPLAANNGCDSESVAPSAR